MAKSESFVTTATEESEDRKFPLFNKVETEVRKKIFGVLSVVDIKGHPHSTGIIFAVSAPADYLAFYVVSKKQSAKVRYIKNNPNVSLVVTFPHYYLRFIPDSTVMFRGTAELVSLDDERAQRAFAQKKMTRMNLEVDSEVLKESIVIRIKPDPKAFCYGVGIGLNEMRKDPTSANYKVMIPQDRLERR